MSFYPFLSISIFFSAYTESDFFGKWIFIGLYALSILCWTIGLYKFWVMRKTQKISRQFQDRVLRNKQSILNLGVEDLPKLENKEIPHPFLAVFLSMKEKTLEILNKNNFFASKGDENSSRAYLSKTDFEFLETQVLVTISEEYKKLDSYLFVLSTIVTLAPFLGLLGTVWGILVTFMELQKGQNAGSNSIILGGLSTALATTVLGLLIAIPALIAFNYLKNASRLLLSQLEDFFYQLVSAIEIQYRRIDE
ncbi:MAG: MotA/TolQ/ExbB proton channel family protein [Rhabdochlamydiaceae bacterium]